MGLIVGRMTGGSVGITVTNRVGRGVMIPAVSVGDTIPGISVGVGGGGVGLDVGGMGVAVGTGHEFG